MELLTWLELESASASSGYALGNILFILYIFTGVLIKKSRYLLAFFFSEFMISFFGFDGLQEYQIYLTDFTVYSYVAYYAHTLKVKTACGIMCLLDLILINDAIKYGVNGTSGEFKTIIYQNIEYLAFYANIIIVSSLLPLSRIYDGICRFFDYAFSVKADSSYMSFFWYNIYKIQSIKQKI